MEKRKNKEEGKWLEAVGFRRKRLPAEEEGRDERVKAMGVEAKKTIKDAIR